MNLSNQTISNSLFFIGVLLGMLAGGCSGSKPSAAPKASEKQPAATSSKNNVDLRAVFLKQVADRDWQGAHQIVSRVMVLAPNDPSVLTAAAKVFGVHGDGEQAAQLLSDAVRSSPEPDDEVIDLAIAAHLEVGQLFEAIELLEYVVKLRPEDSRRRRTLVGFLGEAHMMQQANSHAQKLVLARDFDVALLEMLTSQGRSFSIENLAKLFKRNPNDKRLLLGQAANDYHQGRYLKASNTLRSILSDFPDHTPAAGMLARLLTTTADWQSLAQLDNSIAPNTMASCADWWIAQAAVSFERGHHPVAAQQLIHAIKISATDITAHVKLSEVCRELIAHAKSRSDSQTDSVIESVSPLEKHASQRVEQLKELNSHLLEFKEKDHQDRQAAVSVAAMLHTLGRHWEAEAWAAVAMKFPGESSPSPEAIRDRIIKDLQSKPPWQASFSLIDPSATETFHRASSFYNLKTKNPSLSKSLATNASTHPTSPSILLTEATQAYDLVFDGHTGPDRKGPIVPIADANGCGGGPLDFDRDGKMDLFLAAAGGDRVQRNSDPSCLFRNLGGRFQNITTDACINETGYGQGVTVGDYNQDGFADIYLLNFGENRLLRNNGDGTFSDVTTEVGLGGDQSWSTSAVIVDIDGDGIHDLYTLNYTEDDPGLLEHCVDEEKHTVGCSPLDFTPEANTVHRGKPDGTFEDVREKWIDDLEPGRSLGVVAGRLDGKQMSLFVANDMSANYFLHRATTSGDETETAFRLIDTAASRGLSLDGNGKSQASMGIAVDDIDADGDIDFFVTGFENEFNVVYQQTAEGIWRDRSAGYGVTEDSIDVVSFGVTAMDIDSDGYSEYLIANGHIGFFGASVFGYQQPFFVLTRDSSGKFVKFDTNGWGNYFNTMHAGRAILQIDVNKDLRTDVVVTHNTEPVVLLINKTPDKHHRIAIELIGTRATRDPAGAIVRLVHGTNQDQGPITKVVHRLAGDGYYNSSIPLLRVGLGKSQFVDRLEIDWPSGHTQIIKNLAADRHYVVAEGEEPMWVP